MANSKHLIEKIGGTYHPRSSYEVLTAGHAELIEKYKSHWIDVEVSLPTVNSTRVFAIQDLTPLGKGRFISDFYFEDCGFVANSGDTDPYGFITHWVSFDTIDKLGE